MLLRLEEGSLAMKSNQLNSLVKFGPYYSDKETQQGKFLISHALNQKKATISCDRLVQLILDDDSQDSKLTLEELSKIGLAGCVANQSQSEDFEHWKKRNWDECLHYYLWSRLWNFEDTKSEYDEVRQKLGKQFIQENGSPPFPRVASQKALELPGPNAVPDISLGELLLKRHSVPFMAKRQISDESISSVLWHGFQDARKCRELLQENWQENLWRNFGVPFDIYFVAYDIKNLKPGLYFYDVLSHQIELVVEEDLRSKMQSILIGQKSPKTAACTILFVCEFERAQWRYRHERELRDLYVHVAKMAHYLILAATAYDFKTHITPAIKDSELLELLSLDATRFQCLYTITLG